MERLDNHKRSGINGNALRTWGLLFLAAGIVGRGVIQTHILGIGQLDAAQLLEAISASESTMALATLSLVLQAMETCAVPIFALLLLEGVQHTANFFAYLLRVAGLSLLCEIPYNLAVGGKVLDLGSRNPVFGLALCLVAVYFFRRYAGFGFKNILIKVVVAVSALLWCEMLQIEFGLPLVLLTVVLWAFRSKPLYRNFAGAVAVILCTAISPFFLAAPMGFLAVHFYNGERNSTGRLVTYLAYPVLLLAAAAAGILL